MAEPAATTVTRGRGVLWFSALRGTLGRPPVWLAVWSIEAALALAPALLLQQWLSGALEHRYEAGSQFGNLDTFFRFDHRRADGELDTTNGTLGAVLAVFAVLAGVFCAGGWLQVFLERTRGHSLQRFFLGGARYFWRFLRLALLTVLALAAVTWLVHGTPWDTLVLRGLAGVPKGDLERLESLDSESTAFLLRGAQHATYAVLVALLFVWGDYSRARLALHDTASAIWSGACTAFTMLRHPVKTLRPMIGLLVVETALVLAGGYVARSVEGEVGRSASLAGVALLLAIGQIVLLWRVVLRGSRYHAAVQVSREVVRPIARPDPWQASVGPEGPRYPIGGDEYGMSL